MIIILITSIMLYIIKKREWLSETTFYEAKGI